jgi:hypothetical protein
MTAHFSRYFGSFVFVRRTPKPEFSLTLQPEKTRLIEFGRHGATNRKRRGLGKPETFTFVGFAPSAANPLGKRSGSTEDPT